MRRTYFLAFLLAAAVLAGFANEAAAQRDDRFFFLQLEALVARERAFVARPRLHERPAAANAVGEMAIASA